MLSRRSFLISGASLAAIGGLGYALWPKLDSYEEEVARQRETLTAQPVLSDYVRYATLAANGHNTQPWSFRVTNNQVDILPDYTRRTEVVDPDDHHLFISLGCAAENLVIAAAAHGSSADIQIVEEPDVHLEIALGRASPLGSSPLYEAIPERQSTRSLYDGRPVSSDDLRSLEAAAREEGVDVLFFTNEAQREAILELVVAGNSAQMADPAFVAELREWIRFSPSKAIAMRDGLFSACSGNPVVPELLGGMLFSQFFTPDVENTKYRDHIRSSAGIAVFIGEHADPEHWIKVGRSFQRFALRATSLGIRNAHINQPIEVPHIRPDFARWLGDGDARPDLAIRFGYAPALPMSMRRDVSDVMIV